MDGIDLRSTPSNPVPSGALVDCLTTKDRKMLRYAIWQPTSNTNAKGEARGTVCVFQGRTEFIEKYYEVITDLRERGFTVAVLDWRGQGLSYRRFRNRYRGHVATFRHYRHDLEAFIEVVKEKCPPPYFALAHSMGGHIVFSASTTKGPATFFDRIILSAPMFHLAPEMLPGWHRLRWSRAAFARRIAPQWPARWLSGFLRSLGLGWAYPPGGKNKITFDVDTNPLTSDRERFDRMTEMMEAHPDLTLGSPTIAWVNAACHSMKYILRPVFARNVNVPMLIIAAGADTIVSTPAISLVSPRLRVGQHIVIRRARHEILFERDELRSQFWAAFDTFITDAAPLISTARENDKSQQDIAETERKKVSG